MLQKSIKVREQIPRPLKGGDPMKQTRADFFMVANEIFSFSLTTKAIAVYCCLCRHADVNSHTCFTNHKTIAKECLLGVSAVDRANMHQIVLRMTISRGFNIFSDNPLKVCSKVP